MNVFWWYVVRGGIYWCSRKISHVPFHREGGIAGGFCDHHEDCCPETFVSWTLSFDGLLTWRGNGEIVSSCNLRMHFESVCNSPCHGVCSILQQWIAHVVYLNETDSCLAIHNCTLRVTVIGERRQPHESSVRVLGTNLWIR